MINLLSDTVTLPTEGMKKAMFTAPVGDDVFREDPSINALEERVADMFGKEAALFCPSGTMTNQIAIKCHTKALDEVICDHYSHIYQYETGGYAFNSGVAINLVQGENGKITASQIQSVIKEDYDWLPKSSLVVLENSCNKGGGSYYTLDEIKPIKHLCKEHGMGLHLDGARLFNVLVETKESTKDVGMHFDSISICMSKGLGAPVGSLLIGGAHFIKDARRFRKVMGGGMRQAGYLAAACSYALDHHVDRLKIDNDRAKEIGKILQEQDYVASVRPVQTNILIFDLKEKGSASKFIAKLEEAGIRTYAFGPETIRFVFHLDITDSMMEEIKSAIRKIDI
jgi:threonine aldolase